MLSTTATFGALTPALADAARWLLVIGGDDIASRVNIFEQIFMVFMGLGTLVGVVVIAYTLKNAYAYRDGNDAADEPKGRPQLGELPTGAEKGGRKLFLSFGISAIIVVSLIAWTYGMLLVVEGQTDTQDADDLEIEVEGYQFGWNFEYADDDRIPQETAENIALAVEDDQMDVDSGDIQDATESGDVEPLLSDLRSQAENSEEFSPDDFERDLVRVSTGMSDDGQFRGDSLVLPANQQVFFTITSRDVWHNFGIQDLRVKSDAIPGEESNTWTETGEPTDEPYVAECFELCGAQHSNMKAQVEVLPQNEYDEWYEGETVAVENLDEAVEEYRGSEESDTTERIATPTTGVIGA